MRDANFIFLHWHWEFLIFLPVFESPACFNYVQPILSDAWYQAWPRMEIFLCGIFKILIAARKRPLRKHGIFPNAEEIPVTKTIPEMEEYTGCGLCAPILLIMMIHPKSQKSEAMLEQSTGNRPAMQQAGPQKYFSCLGSWEERAVFSKSCFRGQENKEENHDLVTSQNCWL